jgi:hypothetical protein
MERPPQHVTDSLGQTQLRLIFEPLGWTVNRVEHDYGLDFDIEIFRDFRSTGVFFKLQLKSSDSTIYSANADFVSQELMVRNAQYLCREVRSQVIVVHADVKAKRTFWMAPQLDVGSIRKLLEEANGHSITLRIPTQNELPASIPQLVETLARVENLLATRVVVSSPIPDFISSTKGHIPRERVIKSLKDKTDALRIEAAQEMLATGAGDDALSDIEAIVGDPVSSVEMKFSALLMKERIRTVGLHRSQVPQAEIPEFRLEISKELQGLVKKGPAYLKFHALIARKAAELNCLVQSDWGLFLNYRLRRENWDPIWGSVLAFHRATLIRRITLKYNQCLRLVRYAANSQHRWALPEALLRIPVAAGVFFLRLTLEELMPAADYYSASGVQICKLVAWICEENDDESQLIGVAGAAVMLSRSADGEAVTWARRVIGGIKDGDIKGRAQYLLDRHLKRLAGEPLAGDIEASIRQIVENMAVSLGINISDPNDPTAKLVRVGIDDADPGRVLSNCEHIFVSLGPNPPLAPTGILAHTLGLPSIGPKILHCDLHNYYALGATLDPTYGKFKRQYCDNCSDLKPRPAEWKFSDEWQDQENLRHIKFIEDFYRSGRRTR